MDTLQKLVKIKNQLKGEHYTLHKASIRLIYSETGALKGSPYEIVCNNIKASMQHDKQILRDACIPFVAVEAFGETYSYIDLL